MLGNGSSGPPLARLDPFRGLLLSSTPRRSDATRSLWFEWIGVEVHRAKRGEREVSASGDLEILLHEEI